MICLLLLLHLNSLKIQNIIIDYNTYNFFLKSMSKVVVLITLLLISVINAEEDKYRGPSEEDVIVLDADTLEPTIY